MDESRNADDRSERAPDDTTPSPGDSVEQRPAGGMGLGSCLLVIAGMVVLFLAIMPIGGTKPATRSEKLETQRREQLIEQAMRDAQAADQTAAGEPELAASDRVPQDGAVDAR